MVHDGAIVEDKFARVHIDGRVAGDVTGQRIRRELNPAKAESQSSGKTESQGGLPHARDILDEEIAAGEESTESKPALPVFAIDGFLQLLKDSVDFWIAH
jgi:hypothetical protein